MSAIRPPAVAGLFYPADTRQLAHDVQSLLAAARPHDLTPKALIVPHAGYIYSGPIAATAYATLQPIAARIRRVVLLGPTHRVAVRGTCGYSQASAQCAAVRDIPYGGGAGIAGLFVGDTDRSNCPIHSPNQQVQSTGS